MNPMHYVGAFLVLAIGIYVGAKYPGIVSKVSMGTVTT